MKPDTELSPGMVVQINPLTDSAFAGCFMLITEPEAFGAQGFIAIPQGRREPPGKAFYRAKWVEMEYVGWSTWMPEEEGD